MRRALSFIANYNKDYIHSRLKSRNQRKKKVKDKNKEGNIFLDQNLIFVHIPKTAGSSVAEFLKTVDLIYHNSDTTEVASSFTGLDKHSKLDEYVQVLGEKKLQKAHVITVVRNPWDLYVSSYEWWRQIAISAEHLSRYACLIKQMTFSEFIRSPFGVGRVNEHLGFPLNWFFSELCDVSVQKLRFEYLPADLENLMIDLHLSEIIEQNEIQLPKVNSTVRASYRDYYDNASIDLVQEVNQEYIELCGYKF